jgi:hypothetical protein
MSVTLIQFFHEYTNNALHTVCYRQVSILMKKLYYLKLHILLCNHVHQK